MATADPFARYCPPGCKLGLNMPENQSQEEAMAFASEVLGVEVAELRMVQGHINIRVAGGYKPTNGDDKHKPQGWMAFIPLGVKRSWQ